MWNTPVMVGPGILYSVCLCALMSINAHDVELAAQSRHSINVYCSFGRSLLAATSEYVEDQHVGYRMMVNQLQNTNASPPKQMQARETGVRSQGFRKEQKTQ